MPEYKVIDMVGGYAWIRLPDGSYLVDEQYEKEFIEFWDGKNSHNDEN